MTIRMLMVMALLGCGGSTMNGDDDGGDDDGITPDAPGPATLDPADCTGIAANFVAGAEMCGTPLPGGAQAQLESTCRRGIANADLCGGNPEAGFACFVTEDATDWTCAGTEPLPACNGDLGASLGMFCVMALGNPSCASGIACEFDADCGGASCNGATKQCFDKSAFCVGLPCEFDADCPSGETCNGAEHACVGNN
jgi:hypothetical protein